MTKHAEKSLEASRGSATVSATPFRQPGREPVPYCTVDRDKPQNAAALLSQRVRAIRSTYQCGTYLYVDPLTCEAFAIPETKPAAEKWLLPRFAWLVAVYDMVHRDNAPMLRPTADGILEDLREHLGLPA